MPGKETTFAARFRAAWRTHWPWALACFLLGPLAGITLANFLPATYVSSASVEWNGVLPETDEVHSENLPAGRGRLHLLQEKILTPARLAGVAQELGLDAGGTNGRGPKVDLQRDLVIAPAPLGFTVAISAPEAPLAQQACASVVALFQEAASHAVPGNPAAPSPALASQIDEARRKLDRQQIRLADFRTRHATELGAGGTGTGVNGVMALQAELADTRAALERAAENKSLTEALLREQLANRHRAPAASSPATQGLEQEIAEKQAQLAALETRYTQDYPDVVKMRADLAQLRRKLEGVRAAAEPSDSAAFPSTGEPAEITETRAQLRQIENSIQEKTSEQQRLEQALQAANARQAAVASLAKEYENLTASYNEAQTVYESLLARQRQAQTGASAPTRQELKLRLTEPPSRPAQPTSPDRLRCALGGSAGGLCLGLLLILSGAWADSTLRSERDVVRYLNLPTLAVLPTTRPHAGSVAAGGRGRKKGPGAREESVLADV